MDEPPRAAIVLATHEAVANAIQHAGAPGHVVVRGEFGSDGVVIEVSDDGRWEPPDRPAVRGSRSRALARFDPWCPMPRSRRATAHHLRIHQNA